MDILIKAFMAAAAMALPPRRPNNVMCGIFNVVLASASFDSAAPTKPTGKPRIAEGIGAPDSISSIIRNNAVGALPITIIDPA